jgi:hypothetical protein
MISTGVVAVGKEGVFCPFPFSVFLVFVYWTPTLRGLVLRFCVSSFFRARRVLRRWVVFGNGSFDWFYSNPLFRC